MELQYIILTIIKILISVPTIMVVLQMKQTQAAALIGGHVNNDNVAPKTNVTDFKIDLSEDNAQEEQHSEQLKEQHVRNDTNEEVPDPEPLIVPGYNLPDNIFNKGKPFYLEKDPLTGSIDFNSKSKLYEEYDYDDEIYDKSQIDRKDGPITEGHKPSDINQLTPNFHDFLNLPVKYNPDKYVYPLISSSYANTKVQGNVNKHQNHKNYVVTTYKPMLNPTYLTTKNFHPQEKVVEFPSTAKSVVTYESSDSTTPHWIQSTRRVENLMNSAMNHPSYNEEYHTKIASSAIPDIIKIPSTTTTKRPMSLFEQLFGSDYDDTEMTDTAEVAMSTTTSTTSKPLTTKTQKPSPSDHITNQAPVQLFHNLPNKPIGTTPHPNILTGSNMGDMHVNYDYEEENSAQVAEVPQLTIETPSATPQKPQVAKPESNNGGESLGEYDYDYLEKTTLQQPSSTTSTSSVKPAGSTMSTTVTTTEGIKMTSLPLGENHIHHQNVQHNRPIIVTHHNLREQLNGEKVGYVHPQAPSTSSIHIAPDQDTVSFVMGNHQNVEGTGANKPSAGGSYIGTSLKESPYESNPFRPVYDHSNEEYQLKTVYQVQSNNDFTKPYQYYNSKSTQSGLTGAVTIQPTRNSEASVSIGSQIALKPGHVVDEKIEDVEYNKGTKIVFPDSFDKSSTYSPDLNPPPLPPPGLMGSLPLGLPPPHGLPSKEVLKLNSKPMFHQLPSELTPPDNIVKIPPRIRPPWDPRPGHFHAGRPEYARPPRPQEVYKRIDNLPNILPQFRPNTPNKPIYHHHHHHHPVHQHSQTHGPHTNFERTQPHPHPHPLQQSGQNHGNKNYVRQPLLERPSNNRPIGFFEKLHPPPSAQSKIPSKVVEERIGPKSNIGPGPPNMQSQPSTPHIPPMQEHFAFLQAPPKVVVTNRRNGEDPETLQMIQAKQEKKNEKPSFKSKTDIRDNLINESHKELISAKTPGTSSSDKPIYVVYPVNSTPMKLDALPSNKKESVVIGTRAELPLPPSKIKPSPSPPSSIATEVDFKYEVKDRHDSPILKPRPATFPIKSDFPYPMERPVPSILAGDVENKLPDDQVMVSSNQWNTIEDAEARIVNQHTNAAPASNQISVTLKTYTEKPIAVAYSPTEETSSYPMPNYASLVIPQVRDSEITVSAVMHHAQASQPAIVVHQRPQIKAQIGGSEEASERRPQQEFQAPFQASAHIDHSLSQGWAVVREKEERNDEITTQPLHTTSEFDIENFKPQLEGGFKPIYSYPEESQESKNAEKEAVINERQE